MIQVDYPRKMIEKTTKKLKALLGATVSIFLMPGMIYLTKTDRLTRSPAGI